MNYSTFFSAALQHIKDEGRYRTFVPIERSVGQFPVAKLRTASGFKDVTVWCSNDYLGVGQHPDVLSAMQEALSRYGAGTGGTRNISGNSPLHVKLERELADFHGKEAALIFTSGYVANQTSLSTLGKHIPGCVIFSDALNHASMIEGINHSGAVKRIFKHNDPEDLERLLRLYPVEQPKLVVFESVYSMEGDIAPIQEICEIAEKYRALTYLDEVHGVGLYGHGGGGVAEAQGQSSRISFIQGNFGKTIGLMGGYITGKKEMIDFIRSFAPGFIFTTSLPPVIVAGVLASIRHLKQSHDKRMFHQERVSTLKRKLRHAGIQFIGSQSHIVPVVVGDAVRCKHASDLLLDHFGIYVQPINYPTVPAGTERLRFTPTPLHTNEMIDHLVEALKEVWMQLRLKQAA